ncbi:MAG: type I DNA topoisomerase [Nitrospirota bacterium]
MAAKKQTVENQEEQPVKKKVTSRKPSAKSSTVVKGTGADLLIVESPTKAKTIAKYLGKKFHVLASVGHIKDLPKSRLAIDIEHDFQPEYIVIKGKTKVLSEIKKAAKEASNIYLASDPDREGEAIAWHIAEELKPLPVHRVLLHEITAKGVQEAMVAPGVIDLQKVNAQQARRVLDRLVGYKISPLLWQKVRRGLSAGRVQSVAVRIICEREKEVLAFIPVEYWSIDAKLQGGNPPAFLAQLHEQNGTKIQINNQMESEAIVSAIGANPFVVSAISTKERKKNPAAPFTTSSLQQEAVRKLHFSARRAMAIAQQLYEGVTITGEGAVGLITYMRTDSVRISPDFQKESLEWIEGRYGREYRPAVPPIYKSKKGAQGAHEAIRPTAVMREPDRISADLTREQYLLYKLIWNRFVSSQMNPAVLDVTRVDIAVGEFTFRVTGSVVKFKGFTIVYLEGREEKEEEEDAGLEGEKRLPLLSVGETLNFLELAQKQHFTEPPPRYNEALLIHDLEDRGIGRPSTYAAIISTIQDRKYVEKKENRFYPTLLGDMVNNLLVEHFSEVVDVEFTAQMEESLDQIETGATTNGNETLAGDVPLAGDAPYREGLDWVEVVRKFYTPFSKSLALAEEKMPDIKKQEIATDLVCEKCEKPMVLKWGRFGQFFACSGYPECKSTKQPDKNDATKVEAVSETTNETCDKCGKPMAIKRGRFGTFLACSAYPECKSTKAISTGVSCPEANCTGALVEKKTKRGKNFYSCNKYPDCKFALWDRPVTRPCPSCKAPFLVEKYKAGETSVVCNNKECDYKEAGASQSGATA